VTAIAARTAQAWTDRNLLPAAAGRYLVIVVTVAVAAVVAAFAHGSPLGGHWVLFGLLLACGSLAQITAVHTPANQVFHTGLVFTVVGALLLPPQLVVALCVGQHLAEWMRQRYAWYIQTFNIANYTLSALAASSVVHGVARLLKPESANDFIAAGIAGAVTFVVVNHALLALMLDLARGHSLRAGGLFSLDSLVTDVGLAGLGVAVALAWHNHSLGLVLTPIALLMIYRAFTVPIARSLREHNRELEKQQASLEERIRLRTEALQSANRELEAFSYSVSHDLRAPLRAIEGFSGLVLDQHANDLPPEGRRYLGLVRKNTQAMATLIDGLLAFARLGQQQLSKRSIEVEPLARELVAELEASSNGRILEISVGTLPPARADRALLRQVLFNLLSNAVKYTGAREVARIEIGAYENDGQTVYFVRDNGVGFDMRHADKLFRVFQRLHRAEEYEGTGIGLALVARIVTRHGGRIWAEGKPDEGATFYFTLEGRGS
jgi:signal transduction histidine kinase